MTNEIRSVSSTGGEKGTKDERFDLLPTDSLAKIARHFGVGAHKYEDHNWRRGYEWSKSYAAMQRHLHAFWGGEDIDEETGSPHLAAAGFHVLALLEFMDRFPEFDDRYKAPESEVAEPEPDVFTDELPTVPGFYEGEDGEVWELTSNLNWVVAQWAGATTWRPRHMRAAYDFEDVASRLPLKRVPGPEST